MEGHIHHEYSHRGYSRDEAKSQIIDHLEKAMSMAEQDGDKEEIRRLIMEMEKH